MSQIATSLLRVLARLVPHRMRPRIVRRAEVRCPQTGDPATVDVAEDPDPRRRVVLRCSLHAECPPQCDRTCARQAASATPVAQLLLPPGREISPDQD